MAKIEMGKTYKTAGGFPVRILCIDAMSKGRNIPVVALVEFVKGQESLGSYTENGELPSGSSIFNLVETNAWDDVAVDAEIFVRDSEAEQWQPRHFAKYAAGHVYCWMSGTTSHTSKATLWYTYAKLA